MRVSSRRLYSEGLTTTRFQSRLPFMSSLVSLFNNHYQIQPTINNNTNMNRNILLISLTAGTFSHSATATASSLCDTNPLNNACAPGCWRPDTGFLRNSDKLHCVGVDAGYFSPADSNERFACPPGFVSTTVKAAECTPCSAGSMALQDGTDCLSCPFGTYQDKQGQVVCKSCNPARFKGEGSSAMTNDGYCLFIESHGDNVNLKYHTTIESDSACFNTRGTCAAGCWNDDDIVLDNGKRLCVAVEPGYYSPPHSNHRLPCEKGSISSEYQSEECTPCSPGSIAHPSRTGCVPCPKGTYQDSFGGKLCYGCNPDMYSKPGANNISEDGYCLLQKKEDKVALNKDSPLVSESRRPLR